MDRDRLLHSVCVGSESARNFRRGNFYDILLREDLVTDNLTEFFGSFVEVSPQLVLACRDHGLARDGVRKLRPHTILGVYDPTTGEWTPEEVS